MYAINSTAPPFLRRWGSRTSRLAQARRTRRLLFESLENRSLLALVSWWTADSTALDLAGGNNGTLINGATYAAGRFSEAFSFDGIDDRIEIADSPSLKLTRSLTIEAWIKINAFPSGPPFDHGEILIRADDRGGLDPYSLATEPDGTLRFSIDSGSGGASVQAAAPLGQFVHVVATLNDATGEMVLYLNGEQKSLTVTPIRPFADLDPASNPGVGIGNHGGYPNTIHKFPFNGLIDNLKLYDEALTTEQVLANFNSNKPETNYAPTVTAPPPGIVSWWTGDDTASDLKGDNNGTLSGGASFAAGKVGQAFQFAGINDQFVATAAGLPTGSADRTIELWTKIDQQTTAQSFLASYGDTADGQAFALGRLDSGDLMLVTSAMGSPVSGGSLTLGVWHHVAATLQQGSLVRLFLDGVQVASTNMFVNTPVGASFYLGQQKAPFGDQRRIEGLVDEVTVYNRALTTGEIQAIYAAGSDGKPKTSSVLTVTEQGGQSISAFAHLLFPEVPPGGSPDLVFTTTNDNPTLFTEQPGIDSTGTLTFTPSPNSQGTAVVTVVLNTGAEGEEGGDVDTTTFTIEVLQQFPLQNDLNDLYVNDDFAIAPDDLLLIINYLNAWDSSPVLPGTPPAYPYYDANGDNFIAPDDALEIINYINADGAGSEPEGEPNGESASQAVTGHQPSSTSRQLNELVELLALDVASQPKRRR